MSSREKIIVVVMILAGYLAVHGSLAHSASWDLSYLQQFEHPRAFSRFSTILYHAYPGLKPANAFDGNPNTCFREPLVAVHKRGSAAPIWPQPAPDYSMPSISGEIGLSHSAGFPPRPHKWKELDIAFCGGANSYRPSRIDVQWYRQKLYDVDRDNRVPDAPELWNSTSYRLAQFRTKEGEYRLPVNLAEFPQSSGFPDGFYNVWVRLTFVDAPDHGELCIRDITIPGQQFFLPFENDHSCPSER
ncbi:MAG: hypothetical protein KDK37_01725 [Leptospiraceae bacterium]|nr:hypothetical protein [Leptospiraceae bacterium]